MSTTATKTTYFNRGARLIRRKNNIMNNYINRDDWAGCTPYLLNIEELATIWHFPTEATANAPLIQKTASKRQKPPSNLALEDSFKLDSQAIEEDLLSDDFSSPSPSISEETESTGSTKKAPPSNLPFG